MANPVDTEPCQKALELCRQSARDCRDFLCRLVHKQDQEFFNHFQKVLLAQDFCIARQCVAPGTRCSFAAPLPIKKVGKYGRALDVFSGLVLGDGVFFVQPVGHQWLIQKRDVLLSQRQSKDEFQIVGISQGSECADGFKYGSSDKQIGGSYQKVRPKQRKRDVALFPVERQGVVVPRVGYRTTLVVQKRCPGCHYIDRRFRPHQSQTGRQSVWRKTVVRVEEGYKVAGGAQNSGVQGVMSALIGPGPENDFWMVLAQVTHCVSRTVG